MFKKLFTKKGSAEIVSIVLGIVVIGGLSIAIIGYQPITKTCRNRNGKGKEPRT